MNQEVFIPVYYRQEVFSFIQNNVVTKEDGIGRKTTGDGLIALTNWHLFENQMEDEEEDEENDVPAIINKLLPIRPGKAAGNDLGMLDRRYLWEYVLISEDNFYGLSRNGATITDICDRCKVSLSAAMGELFV